MKITAMRCPNCGANVEVHEEGALNCKYCGQPLYAESEKAPAVHNTVINNYNGYDNTKNHGSKSDENKSFTQNIVIAVFVGIITIFVITMISLNSKKVLYEDDLIVSVIEDEDTDTHTSEYEVAEGESNINNLITMVNLKILTIPDASNISDYSALYYMPGLEKLTIKNAKELEDADFLSDIVKLQYLYIEGSKIDDLSILSNNLSITELVLENNEELLDYTFLTYLPSLKKLKLTTAQGALIPDLSQHKFLTDIEINGEIK